MDEEGVHLPGHAGEVADHARGSRRSGLHVWAFIAALSLGAGALLVGVVPRLDRLATPLSLPWWVLLGAFVVSEPFVVHVEASRSTRNRNFLSFSLGEIPLLLGLFFAAPLSLVAARLLGTGIVLVAQRQQPVKVAFNLSIFALETGTALALFHLLLAGGDPLAPLGWAAAFAAAAAACFVGTSAVPIVVALKQGEWQQGAFRRLLPMGFVATMTNTSLGLLAVIVLSIDRRAGWLLLQVAVLLFVAYRGYVALGRKHATLEALHDFTREVGGSVEHGSAVPVLLNRTREIMRAEVVELLVLDGGMATRHHLDADDVLRSEPLDRPEDVVRRRLVTGGRALRLSRGAKDASFRGLLIGSELRDLLLVPLRIDAVDAAALLVGNRLGDVETFGEADLRLLTTMANHASVSLNNEQLISRLRREVAEKQHQATHDALTDLPNRTSFHERLTAAVQGRDVGRVHAVALLDLDHFKEINDTLGHHTGDLLLQHVSRALTSCLAPGDTVARLGGDEFGLLMSDVGDAEPALARVEELRRTLSVPFELGELRLQVGASAGVALCPEHGEDASALLRRADVAMYQAKQDRSGVELYDPSRDEHSPRRLALAGRLGEAIESGELEVHYQPKAALRTGAITGAEALARWRHPRYGRIAPDEFIAMAEQVGLIRPLTNWVLDQVLQQWKRWRAAGVDLEIAVNLSMWSLLDHRLPDDVGDRLAAHGVPADRLRLEITESSMMHDPHRVEQVLRALSDLGIGLSVDDYGTGYSSLAWLKRLPIDEVKIDRTFVRDLSTDEDDAAIVRSTIELARSLNLWVVAEGAEDQWTWDRLASLGCDVAQGYHLSPALPPQEFDRWLRRHTARLSVELEQLEAPALRVVADGPPRVD